MLCSSFKVKHCKSGDFVFKTGAVGDFFYVVVSGEIEIIANGELVRVCGKFDYFGERALLYNEPRSNDAVCSTDCELWILDKFIFKSLVSSSMRVHLENRIRLQDNSVTMEQLNIGHVIGKGDFFKKILFELKKNNR